MLARGSGLCFDASLRRCTATRRRRRHRPLAPADGLFWDSKEDTERMTAQSLACEICPAALDIKACRRLVCLQCGPDDSISVDDAPSDSTEQS